MARLVTCGCETGNAHAEGVISSPNPTQQVFTTTGAKVRSGGFALELGNANACNFDFTGVTGRYYFWRMYYRPTSHPGSDLAIMEYERAGGGLELCELRHQADGTLLLWLEPAGTSGVSIASSGLTLNAWNEIEVGIGRVANGQDYLGLRLGRVLQGELSNLTLPSSGVPGRVQLIGRATAAAFDDMALNDSLAPTGFTAGQPGAQDTWPGYGRVFLVPPTADLARAADWLAGAGATTSLFEALNNTPPVGVASATNASQVKNSTAGDTAEDLDLTLQTYAAAGVLTADGIRVAQTLVNTAAASSQSGMGAIKSVSNPAEAAETTFDPYGGAGMGTFPTGWKTTRGPVLYLPTLDKTVAPVIRIGKRGASTARMDADLVGLYIESGEPVSGGGQRMWT